MSKLHELSIKGQIGKPVKGHILLTEDGTVVREIDKKTLTPTGNVEPIQELCVCSKIAVLVSNCMHDHSTVQVFENPNIKKMKTVEGEVLTFECPEAQKRPS